MAIRTFCTTLCAALATMAAAPASAFDLPSGMDPAAVAAVAPGSDAQRDTLAPRQPAGHVVLDANAFVDMTGKPVMLAPAPALPGIDSGTDSIARFWHSGIGGMALRPNGLEAGPSLSTAAPAPDSGNLPLLGAAAIALLVAQLRRSQRPTVR